MTRPVSCRTKLGLAASALVSCLALTAPARAKAPPPSDAVETSEDSDPVAHAEAVASRAFQQYRDGMYVEAVASYLEAQALSPSADLLFNLARLYDRHLDDPPLAMDFYRKVIVEPGAGPARVTAANERLAALRVAQAEEQRQRLLECSVSPAPVARLARPADSEWTALQTTGVGMALTGLAAVGVGLGFGVTAVARRDSEGIDTSGAATVATISLLAGGVLAATGTSLYLWGDDTSDDGSAGGQGFSRDLRWVASAGPSSASVTLLGHW